MKKNIFFLFSILFLFTLNGCSEWDDFVDTITGDDDDDQPAATTTTTTTAAAPPTTTNTTATTSSTSSTSTSTSSTSTGTAKESGYYNGRYNGDRPTWYFSKKMASYPRSFKVTIVGCYNDIAVSNNGARFEYGGVIVKQSDVSGRGMAVIAPSSCRSTSAYIQY